MFNLLSNIATITNFVVLNLCMSFIFVSMASTNFDFWIFNYSADNGGLAGFYSFLVSFFAGFLLCKLVFNSNNKLGAAIPIYLLTVVIVYVICMYIPTLVLGPISSIVGKFWGTNITNMINIMVQVIIIYPVLKFVVMKKVPEQDAQAS